MQWSHPAAATLGRGNPRQITSMMRRVNPNHDDIVVIAELAKRRRHAVFGCHARNAHLPREARQTMDIDILVPDGAAAKRFGDAILKRLPTVTTRVLPFGMVQIIDSDGEKIADLVPADEPITMAAIATAKRRPVPGVTHLRVPPREILIAMKLESAGDARRKRSRADMDWADAGAMFDAGGVDERALLAALELVSPRARRLYRKLKGGGRAAD